MPLIQKIANGIRGTQRSPATGHENNEATNTSPYALNADVSPCSLHIPEATILRATSYKSPRLTYTHFYPMYGMQA